MAAILDVRFGGNDYDQQFCGGSLIAPSWVLTAAHCVEDASAANLRVAIGRRLLNNSPPQGEKIAVERVVAHEDYDPVRLTHDTALLKLVAPSSFAPIDLAESTPEHDLLHLPRRLRIVVRRAHHGLCRRTEHRQLLRRQRRSAVRRRDEDPGRHRELGNGCAKRRFPGVYSEVNSPRIRNFIRSTAGV